MSIYDSYSEDIIIHTKQGNTYGGSQNLLGTRYLITLSDDIFMDNKDQFYIRDLDSQEYKKITIPSKFKGLEEENIFYLHPSTEEIQKRKEFLTPLIKISSSLLNIISKFL